MEYFTNFNNLLTNKLVEDWLRGRLGPSCPEKTAPRVGGELGQPDILDQLQSISRQSACRQKQKEANCKQTKNK